MQSDVFCQIVAGIEPARIIYEDEQHMALLNIHPTALGHVLVIPKKHVENYLDMPTDEWESLMRVGQMLAQRLATVLESNRVFLKIIGVDVPHVHVHLIPESASTRLKKHQLSAVYELIISDFQHDRTEQV